MEDWQLELKSKTPDLSLLANWMEVNPEQIPLLVEGLTSPDETFRFNSFNLVLQVCGSSPKLIYPFWNQFVQLLRSDNNFQRSIAVQILAALCKADQNQWFETIQEEYFGLLNCGSIMTARYIIQSASLIFIAKPDLREDIKDLFLHIDSVSGLIPDRIDLLKTDILVFFETVFEYLQNPDEVIEFAQKAITSQSPKTRKQAKIFLKEHYG